MATTLPSNVYSGGAVTFNTQPLATMYLQFAAQRKAKEDALDNYFRDLNKNVTPAGMRSQDIPGLTKKTNEWQQFYQQNKSAILNPRLDNGKAYSEYMGRYQDQLAHIQQSKDALKTIDELNKTRLNPQTSFILDDPTIIDQIHQHDLPIGDPNRRDINLATLVVPPKPWDIKDREAYAKYRTQGLAVDEIPGKTQFLPGFKTLTPITKQYSDNNLMVIGERGKSLYDTDRGLQAETNRLMKQIESDPAHQQQLNNVYRRIYGKDIETPRELRAAQDILEESKKSIEYKQGEDVFGREKAMEAIRFGHQKELKKSDQAAADSWIDNFWKTRITNAKSGEPTPLFDPNKALGKTFAHEIVGDPVMMKALSRNGVEPNQVFVTSDNKIYPVFYEYKEDYDANGKKIGVSVKKDNEGKPSIDWEVSKPMDLDQAYLAMGYKGETKKQLSGTMGGTYKEPSGKSNSKYTLDGKTYTHKQLNDMGYDDNEIEQAKKAGLIK